MKTHTYTHQYPALSTILSQGTGPNHIKFHPSGSVAISLNANANSLTIIPSDPASTNFNFAANTVSILRAEEVLAFITAVCMGYRWKAELASVIVCTLLWLLLVRTALVGGDHIP